MMPYIPKQHKKYNLLPLLCKYGGEVFDYPVELLNQIEERGISGINPYGFKSYETYLNELDRKIECTEDTLVRELIARYKSKIVLYNKKENWSIVKYIGADTKDLTGLTKDHYYYWPTSKEDAIYRGVIDDEEYTTYLYATDPELWEIAKDPTGMASRAIYWSRNKSNINDKGKYK